MPECGGVLFPGHIVVEREHAAVLARLVDGAHDHRRGRDVHTIGQGEMAQHHGAAAASNTAAAEAAWTSIATASQKGLWWCEGPVVLFWGLIVGKQLKDAGWGKSILWPLSIVGWCFGLFFVCGFFQSLAVLTNLLLVVVVLIFPLWLMMFGAQLLRGPKLLLADQLQ